MFNRRWECLGHNELLSEGQEGGEEYGVGADPSLATKAPLWMAAQRGLWSRAEE